MSARLTLLVLLLISACATEPGEPQPVARPLFVLPYTTTNDGHLVVEASLEGAGPFRLLIDTGSTRSGLLEAVAAEAGLWPSESRPSVVRGLQSQEERPVIDVEITLGGQAQGAMPLVILRDRRAFDADGILGMDVLGRYAFLADAEARTVAFGTDLSFAEERLRGWDVVRLTEAPRPLGESLPFARMKMTYRRIPMLLDTGSPVNVINHQLASILLPEEPLPSRIRTRIEDVNAEETFPQGVVIYGLEVGEARWARVTMLILPLTPLSVIGSLDGPFAIGGIDLFDGRSFALDHRAGMLLVCPEGLAERGGC
jgi:hypothetical protein